MAPSGVFAFGKAMAKAITKDDGGRRGASHKAYWRDLIARNLDDYRKLLNNDPFKDWSRWRFPDWSVEGPLEDGIMLLSGDASRELADGYFRKGSLIGHRLIADKSWRRRKWCAFRLPASIGLIRRATAYCELFLGQPLDPDTARHSASEITQFHAGDDSDEGWAEDDQQDFIGGVVLLLVAKQFDEAVRLIRLGWKCPSHAAVWKHVRDIGEALAAGTPVARPTRIAFAKQLELIRKPLRVATIPAFELHLLEQLVQSPTATPDPYLAVARMSR